jgi:hypothetical protein
VNVRHDHRDATEANVGTETESQTAWCETCGVARTKSQVRAGIDGDDVCRTCGEPVEFVDDEQPIKAPWHFKVLLLGTVGYLIYRLIWFIEWISHR